MMLQERPGFLYSPDGASSEAIAAPPQKLGPEHTEPERRKASADFDETATTIPGVWLRIPKGAEAPILPTDTVAGLLETARIFASTDFAHKVAGEQQTTAKKNFIELVQAVAKVAPDVKGVASDEHNFRATVSKREELTPVREVLIQALGPLYGSLVHEDYSATINAPASTETKSGKVISATDIKEALHRTLKRLGLSGDEIGKILNEEISLRVDTKELASAVKEQRVTLSPGAFTEVVTWTAQVTLIRKKPQT